MKLLILFWELFRISLFIIGGGYAIIAVADETFARRGWTEEGELLEHLPVFQTIPGLIATHTAVYVGRKVAGSLGAAICVVAVALPSVLVFTCVAMGYESIPLDNPWLGSAFVGLRSALTGIILATIVRGWRRNLPDGFAYAVMLLAFAALGFFLVPAWAVLVVAMAMGLAAEYGNRPKGRRFESSCWLGLLLFLKYGALCFGGGFVLVPMYIQDFVGAAAPFLQIAHEEFSNVIALSQMTPGPIGVNGATFFGYRLCGVPGAVLASAALLLPGSALCYLALSSLDRFRTSRAVKGLMRGIRPASVALMLVALWAFAGMCCFAPGHASWCTFGASNFNPVAVGLVAATVVLTMKKKLGLIAIVVVSALAATVIRAEDALSARFPDADEVVVDDVQEVVYEEDGTSVSVEDERVKVLTERGRRERSVISLGYNARYGRAEILSVSIVGTDGVERAVDVSGTTKEATDNSSTAANIYDPLERRITCSVPGLAVGDTLRVRTRRSVERARVKDAFADIYLLEWTAPILRAEVRVSAPAARPLRRIALRHPLGNVVSSVTTNDAGRVLYTWLAEESPQAFPEPDMPPLYTEVQGLHVSTSASWEEISAWYWNLCAPHLAATNAALVAKVGELRRENAGGDLLRAIYTWVAQNVRYMGLTMEDTSPGYAPHDVDVTFDNRYGVCRDKAALLVAMLRLAGFEAYPVLIHVGPKMDPEVPLPFFNHAIVAVATGGERRYVLLDPTDESSRDLMPAYLGNRSYLVARPEGETLLVSPVAGADANAVKVESEGTLEEDGSVLLSTRIDFLGVNDNVYRGHLLRQKPPERRKAFERMVRGASAGAELESFALEPADLQDTDSPLRAKLRIRLPETLLRGVTRDEFVLPFLSRQFGAANWLLEGSTSLVTRRFPLDVFSTAATEERVTVALGDDVGAPLALPDPVAVEGPYEFRRAYAVTNGVFTAHRRLAVNAVEFPAATYGALRESVKAVEAEERRRPVFGKDPDAKANVHVRLNERLYSFSSPTSWTVTNTVVKEILTYDGKKKHAELKFAFNPTWKNVEVVSAVVSNRDGRVSAVTDREKTLLDCGWAAGAPRYPASRELVVNLPSVEIGSVVSCTTVTTVSNAPAAFYGVFYHDTFDPTDRIVERLDGETVEIANPKTVRFEPAQPDGDRWRQRTILSRGDFAAAARRLRPATDLAPLDPALTGLDAAALKALAPADRVKALRDWMAKNVKLVGPSLYEVPLDLQLTDPAVVLKERYATRLDYVRTLTALLRGAGLTADVVFASTDADLDDADRRCNMELYPNERAFAAAVCRVTTKEGGFLWWGGRRTTYFVGTENEYAPLGATIYAGSHYLDPATGGFATVTTPSADLEARRSRHLAISVRENGSVDIDVTETVWGPEVGTFRRQYAEMLPELRDRHYQELLGGIAQAAEATGELVTDVESYPATLRFSCYVPHYVVVADDALTLALPGLAGQLFPLTGKVRETPIAIGATDPSEYVVDVTFPRGYDAPELTPGSFTVTKPDGSEAWVESSFDSTLKDGALTARLVRKTLRHRDSVLDRQTFETLKAWNKTAAARANRTITVRKTGK